MPSITAVGVDGASNAPGPRRRVVQVNLDIDIIGAAAPGAAQVMYFAPNNGDQGFVDAISAAAHATPAPIAISISWGQSEDSWIGQGLLAMNEAMADAVALGITVCVAAGNDGSTDGANDGQLHVDFPVSSPYALGCGDHAAGRPVHRRGELGGGLERAGLERGRRRRGSQYQFALPAWQANAGVPARPGAAETAPSSRRAARRGGQRRPGHRLPGLPSARPRWWRDRAVAPLWSALITRLAQATGQRFGLLRRSLRRRDARRRRPGFRDITSGNNGAYSAGPGWDACTGLGVPDGTALLTRLQAERGQLAQLRASSQGSRRPGPLRH